MESDECVFCQIVDGQAEASIPYQDDATVAFMDLRQFHPGHTLIVPRMHVEDLFALDVTLGAALMAALTRVARAVRDAYQPDGLNIWQSNGAPWQEVFHLHFHVLPRWKDDDLLRFTPPPRDRPSRSELDQQAASIKAYVS